MGRAIMPEPIYGPARARATDPATSHEAAASIQPKASTRIRDEILQAFSRYGPMTDEEIADHLSWLNASPSGMRTRRAELVAAGLIEQHSADGRTSSGRRCAVWQLVSDSEPTLF